MPVDMTSGTLTDVAVDGLRDAGRPDRATRRPRISVGVINNMPDLALQPTERQFVTHLAEGAEQFDLRVHLFTLPGIHRSEEVRDRVKAKYLDSECLSELHMDALVVTGAGPKAASLGDERYWPQLTMLADWASTHTLSVLWSCLSAHAAVLHLDGIERHRLPKKLSGLQQVTICNPDPVLNGIDPVFWIPHSRYNGLPEESLRAAGYTILSRSDTVGVDMFSKSTPSLFVFCQGHPEYDGDTLMREYRRDVIQYLAHERSEYPDLPSNYFDSATEVELNMFARRARRERSAELSKQFPDLRGAVPHIGVWHSAAAKIFRNWINHVADLKTRQRDRQGATA